ncbi:DMT family transporter [Candidatus Woesebacteria bacterium]|nr:DMT family transporter [Candidatus Woesebacteria bacterium]
MSWFTLLLATVVIDSVIILAQKKWAMRKSHNSMITGALYQVVTGLFFLVVAIATHNLNLNLGVGGALIIIASTALFTLSATLWFYALQRVPATTATIVMSTRTIFVLVLGFVLLGESVTLRQFAGMTLIMTGVVYSQYKDKLNFKLTFIGILVLNAFVASLANIVDRVATKSINLYTYLALAFLLPGLIMLLIQKISHQKLILHLSRDYVLHIVVIAILFVVSASAYLAGLSIAPSTGLVVFVNQTKVVLTVILAVLFLHERGRARQKMISSVFCLIGLYLLN